GPGRGPARGETRPEPPAARPSQPASSGKAVPRDRRRPQPRRQAHACPQSPTEPSSRCSPALASWYDALLPKQTADRPAALLSSTGAAGAWLTGPPGPSVEV